MSLEVRVHCLEGRNLTICDSDGTSDPFLTIGVEDKKGKVRKTHKTKVINDTLSPTWDETFTFEVAEGSVGLRVECNDKDMLTKEFMGHFLIPMDALRTANGAPQWYTLEAKSSKKPITGEIRLGVYNTANPMDETATTTTTGSTHKHKHKSHKHKSHKKKGEDEQQESEAKIEKKSSGGFAGLVSGVTHQITPTKVFSKAPSRETSQSDIGSGNVSEEEDDDLLRSEMDVSGMDNSAEIAAEGGVAFEGSAGQPFTAVISVVSARGLADRDSSANDAFVVVGSEDQKGHTHNKKKSKVSSDAVAPRWDAAFKIPMDATTRGIRVEVWDKEKNTKMSVNPSPFTKTFLGQAFIAGDELFHGAGQERWLGLQPKRKSKQPVQGEVQIIISEPLMPSDSRTPKRTSSIKKLGGLLKKQPTSPQTTPPISPTQSPRGSDDEQQTQQQQQQQPTPPHVEKKKEKKGGLFGGVGGVVGGVFGSDKKRDEPEPTTQTTTQTPTQTPEKKRGLFGGVVASATGVLHAVTPGHRDEEEEEKQQQQQQQTEQTTERSIGEDGEEVVVGEDEVIQYQYTTEICLKSGRCLISCDKDGTSDPFIIMGVEDHKGKLSSKKQTRVVQNTLSPLWDETFTLTVRDDQAGIRLFCYDKDMFTKTFMGKALITPQQLWELNGKEEFIQLYCEQNKTEQGEILISFAVDRTPMAIKKKKDIGFVKTGSGGFFSAVTSTATHNLNPMTNIRRAQLVAQTGVNMADSAVELGLNTVEKTALGLAATVSLTDSKKISRGYRVEDWNEDDYDWADLDPKLWDFELQDEIEVDYRRLSMKEFFANLTPFEKNIMMGFAAAAAVWYIVPWFLWLILFSWWW